MKPIAYTVRESARAKQVRLQVSSSNGLIVVVPRGFNRTQIPELLRLRHAWIEKHLQRFAAQQQQAPRCNDFPPCSLHLRAIVKQVFFSYESDTGHTLTAQEWLPGEWQIRGNLSASALRNFFHHWLRAQAKRYLEPKLTELSHLAGLPYQRLLIKGQKTRWGSCSNRGNINLNYKLLFLPAPQARYVLLHELAHTRHLDHSPAFWALLESLEPNCRTLDKAVDSGWMYVPTWI